MHVAFLNPQGNFDPQDSYWTAHPDFGGQLVYVKQLALAMGELGHRVDILTRRIEDPAWPEFAGATDAYPGHPRVRILRVPCGPPGFLKKEDLWPHLGAEWAPRIVELYESEGALPDLLTAHYGDGGLAAVLLAERTGIPFSFTAHSLGAQKMDKLGVSRRNLAAMDAEYHFAQRLVAERLAMNRSAVNVTSTAQERYSQYTHTAYRGAVDPSDDARFAVVPPGVAMEIFDRASRYPDEEAVHAHVRACLARDLAPERVGLPCVVASSRLDPKKNHLGLAEAFAQSPALQAAANLCIITADLEDPLRGYEATGPTERGVLDRMMETIDRAELRGKVTMFALRGQGALAAGYRALARQRSVFALTALYEPFGLAPLEAMAAGLPAVVTKNGGPAESLREGDDEYGVLVDPTDPISVSAGLYGLVARPERWERFAEAGYGRVLARYTWTRTAEGYLRALAGRQRSVDRTEAEERATGGAESPAGADALAPEAAPEPRRALPVHPSFTDSARAIPLAELDDLYLGLDLVAVGETLVDFISHERVQSLRTAAEFTRYLGGQPANVAVYVAKLGGRSAVLSKIGDEYFGEFLQGQLERHGVSTEGLLRTADAPTTTVFVTRTIAVPDFQVNRGADALLHLREVPEELIERARAVHTSAFALSREPQRSAVRRALRLALRHRKLVSFDPNYSAKIWPDKEEAWEVIAEIMPTVTVAKPSLEDARRLFDPNMTDDELEAACLREFHDLGAETVIVTRSGGMVTISDGGSVESVGPLPTVPVENVTGGRDAFWGALLLARLDGKPWPLCVRFAHEVAALKLQVTGHVERSIDRDALYAQVEAEARQPVG